MGRWRLKWDVGGLRWDVEGLERDIKGSGGTWRVLVGCWELWWFMGSGEMWRDLYGI